MNFTLPASARTAPPWKGIRLSTDTKISTDMPLPIPRCVISSPSHITRAVPAVSVSTTSITRGTVKCGMRSNWAPLALRPRNPRPPLWNTKASPVDCMRASATVR